MKRTLAAAVAAALALLLLLVGVAGALDAKPAAAAGCNPGSACSLHYCTDGIYRARMARIDVGPWQTSIVPGAVGIQSGFGYLSAAVATSTGASFIEGVLQYPHYGLAGGHPEAFIVTSVNGYEEWRPVPLTSPFNIAFTTNGVGTWTASANGTEVASVYLPTQAYDVAGAILDGNGPTYCSLIPARFNQSMTGWGAFHLDSPYTLTADPSGFAVGPSG